MARAASGTQRGYLSVEEAALGEPPRRRWLGRWAAAGLGAVAAATCAALAYVQGGVRGLRSPLLAGSLEAKYHSHSHGVLGHQPEDQEEDHGYSLRSVPLGNSLEAKYYAHSHGKDQGEDHGYKTAHFPSQCGLIELDTDYVVDSDWGHSMDHIPTAEMCCALCQGVEQCESWVWVADAGLDGCPSQCWVKGGKPTSKSPKQGVVAGIPPPRRSLPKVLAPAAPKKGKGSGSVYCFSLVQPQGYEKELLTWQFDHKFSIFACDQYDVYSNKAFEVVPGVTTHVVDSDLKCDYGGDSGTALNAWIFIAVWKKVIEDGHYKKHDWVVKADPDAVLFVDRLRVTLAKNEGAGYINNCRFGMHGPIEVVSSRAVSAMADDYAASWDGKAPKRCVTEQDFGLYGEDMWLDQCLGKILQVDPVVTDSGLMCEDHCDCEAWYWCNSGSDRVSYHPFKSTESYANCIANAMSGQPAMAA